MYYSTFGGQTPPGLGFAATPNWVPAPYRAVHIQPPVPPGLGLPSGPAGHSFFGTPQLGPVLAGPPQRAPAVPGQPQLGSAPLTLPPWAPPVPQSHFNHRPGISLSSGPGLRVDLDGDTPTGTPSTGLTSLPARDGTPKLDSLDRFAKSYVPRWLIQVSEDTAKPYPLLAKPKRMSKADGIAYAEELLPPKFMHAIDTELEKVHTELKARLNKMFASGAEWRTFIDTDAATSPGRKRTHRLPELPPLAPTSYGTNLLPLLLCEHTARRAQLNSIRLYLTDVLIRDREQGLLSLEARSVREGWPPVDLGDTVGLRRLWPERLASDGYEYEARVTSIRRVDGLLVLHCPQLIRHVHPLEDRVACNVLFSPQDSGFFQMHAAVERLHQSLSGSSRVAVDWLFPEPSEDRRLDDPIRIPGALLDPWRDADLNAEQQHAVRSFVLHRRRHPFLISGAPGSGKTKACVEAVLQTLASDPHAHVLLCGASNPSADTLALRLIPHLDRTQLFRLYDSSRGIDEVRSQLIPYTYTEGEGGYFALPPIADLLKKRVVVCACVDAALLDIARCSNASLQRFDRLFLSTIHPTRFPAGTLFRPHFSHLIVDEAGQASETELATALAVALPDDKSTQLAEIPQVLICGDIKQLPPHIISDAARRFDYDVSLLQRLLERPFYADHPSARKNRKHGRPVTLDDCLHFVDLVRNYRSHRTILMLPSALFYNDTLEPCAPSSVQNSELAQWGRLPTPGVPLLFGHVDAPEDWVDEGGSWFNVGECDAVLDAIERLVFEDKLVKGREISVISPFREQVWKIRTRLRKQGLGDVDVGNVEALQGAENRVIIISTVRSRHQHRIAEDRERNRGLIFAAQTFNVALTRAKELLIVFGNAATLTLDPNWRSFWHFTRRVGAYQGPDIPGLPEDSAADMSRLEEAFHQAKVNGSAADVTDPALLLAGSMVRSLGINGE